MNGPSSSRQGAAHDSSPHDSSPHDSSPRGALGACAAGVSRQHNSRPSVAMGRDRLLFAVFLAAVVHAGLILGLGAPFPAAPERATDSIAIVLAPPPEAPPPSPGLADEARPVVASEAVAEPDRGPTPVLPAPAPDAPSLTAEPTPEPPARQPWHLRDYEQTVREVARIPPDAGDGSTRTRRVTGVSPATPQLSYYFEAWRRKVERVGNLNYPEAARARGLYGSLRLLVAIAADGTLTDVRVLDPSGHQVLDDAAVRIVRLAAPFAPFPPVMRRNTDVLEIVRTWQFRRHRDGFRL